MRSGASRDSVSLANAGYLPPEPSTGQISAMLGAEEGVILPMQGNILGSSHSQVSSAGDIRSLSSFGPPSGGAVGGIGRAQGSMQMEQNIASLLRNRSSGGLAGVEVGPLLGRGSYGRVYKGQCGACTAWLCCLTLGILVSNLHFSRYRRASQSSKMHAMGR